MNDRIYLCVALTVIVVIITSACISASSPDKLQILTTTPNQLLTVMPSPKSTKEPREASSTNIVAPVIVPPETNFPTASKPTDYEFHVAVDGSDDNPGTSDRPFATIEHARDVIKNISPNMDSPIIVYIHGGIYAVTEPIKFSSEDSGQNGYDIIYRAADGETPILSGGIAVAGWERVSESQIWKTILRDVKLFRQLYVNGIRTNRSRSPRAVTGIRWATRAGNREGIVISSSLLPDISNPLDLEIHWIYDWKDMRLPVAGIDVNEDGTKTIWMEQPYFSHALWMGSGNNHPWYPKFDVPFYLENALELLDEPGEWYFNQNTGELYYLPREGEHLNNAEVIIPQTEILLEITGGSTGVEVHNLIFDGLTFAYGGWTRASRVGTFYWQAQYLINQPGGEKDDQEKTLAHVQLNSAHDIRFERCRFEHLGGAGLDLNHNVYRSTVRGNLFHDISDGAIVIGHWEHAYDTDNVTHDNEISNNLIKDVGVEYWGAPAITAYYVNNP